MAQNIGDDNLNREDPHAMADALVHGLLTDAEAARVRGRVAESAAWRAALDAAYARHSALLSLASVEPSEKMIRRVLEAIPDPEIERAARAKRRNRVLGVVGGVFSLAAAVILAFNVYFATLSPSGADVRIVAPAELLAGSRGAVRIAVFSGVSNKPLAARMVRVSLAKQNGETKQWGPFETDGTGACRAMIDVPDWADGQYSLTVDAGGEKVTRSVGVARAWRLMLSTDKPVYQPGQTILMRALTLSKPDGKPVAGRDVVFTLADPKGTVLFKQRTVTGEFGITSAECPLADEITEGAYTLAAAVGDTRSERTVEIKRYVLPKFKVDVELDKPYYGPGEVVRGAIAAAYFFGKPVAGTARVEFAGRSVVDRVTQLAPIALNASGKGVFEFRLPDRLIGDDRDAGDARIDVSVSVSDTGGQEQGRMLSRIVTARPLRLSVIPESAQPLAGVPNRLYVLVTTPDGQPVPASISVTGIAQAVRTSELGVATVEWTPAGPQPLTVTATAEDGRSTSYLISELSPSANPAAFLLRTDRGVYDAGDTMTITAIGAGVEPLYIDFIKDGQIVLTRELAVKDGSGTAAIDLPAELSGTLELNAYRYDPSGLPVRQSRALLVRPGSGLNVTVTADRPEYRPGGEAGLSLLVTDEKGTPVPSAISLAAVDEAVYSVQDQRPGLERVFFSLDQELLKPAVTLYPWDPFDPGRGPARDELSLAMSAATVSGRGENPAIRRIIDEGFVSEELVQELREPGNEGRLQRLIANGSITPQAAAALRGDSASAGLIESSTFPMKVAETEMRRRQGLREVVVAWGFFAAAAVVAGLVLLAIYVSGGFTAAMLFVILVIIVAIMLPALGKARASSRGLRFDSSARSVGQALEMAGLQAGGARSGLPGSTADAPPRLRAWFPETLLWRPQIITDDQGRASLPVHLADSITTWRLSGSAVSRKGDLGSVASSIRVFQPFFVDIGAPVALTRGDEVAMPITVYNYLENAQEVRLTVQAADWFELRGPAERTLSLAPNEVRSLHVRIRAAAIGRHALTVSALGAGIGDAIKREIDVVSDGTPHERVLSGTLDRPAAADITLPSDTIPGSAKLLVKIYPSAFSQLVDGLDNIFRMPYGCFEQTSSTTYPNVLALQYLQRTNTSVPAVEVKARQFIHLGYQRLVGFEVPGGGFDWFGHPPANITLTAYGLMEFRDMATVHDVDSNLIAQTRDWLLSKRLPDGSWPDARGLHEDITGGMGAERTLATTAYVAWSVFAGGDRSGDAAPTLTYLTHQDPAKLDNPHTLALVANALIAIRPEAAAPYLRRLAELAVRSPDGKLAHWQMPGAAGDRRTTFYGSGDTAAIETTSLAALAFIGAKSEPALTRSALSWLTTQRDGAGTWGSTQATVLALKALIGGTGAPVGGEVARIVEVAIDGKPRPRTTIPADQAEVMRQLDLSGLLAEQPASLSLTEVSGTGCAYQVILRYNTPAADVSPVESDLSVDVAYDRMELKDGETVGVTATLRNRAGTAAPMLMVDLPVPPGFAPDTEAFDRLVAAGSIAKYQVTPRQVIVYLLGLDAGATLRLPYALRATMPVDAAATAARVYEYYNPKNEAFGGAGRLIVR